MNFKPTKIALACGAMLFTSSAMATSDIDFFGYMRAGAHISPNSSNGNGHPDYISAEGAAGKYRLGNEDDWMEFGLKSDLVSENGQRGEIGIMIGSWHDVQEFGGGISDSFDVMQVWGQLHGVFGSDVTSMWAGKLYPRSIADDMLDYEYWDNYGRGFGLRDIELPGMLMDVTYNYNNGEMTNPGETPDEDERFITAVHLPELRVHGIEVPGGNLALGINLASVVDDEVLKEEITKQGNSATTNGYMLTASHSGNFAGFDNILTIQYTDGIGVAGWSGTQIVNVEAPGSSVRLFNHGNYTFNDKWSAGYSIAFEDIDMEFDNKDGKEWFNAGIRPRYNWNTFTQTELELGYQQAKSKTYDGTNTSAKATLSQKFHFGDVPHIRLYVTYAEQDTHWSEVAFGEHSSVTNDKFDSVSFGAQFEVWW
ncbi:carbohydrate porin [Vibrio kyushuensis]|uniref:carbohydrate porin n=1 Tax=Vibrio TaxID=662 RepID=UPI003D132E5B